MQNVSIAQIGQTAVNKPFYEVVVANKKYALHVYGEGRARFLNRRELKNLGVSSIVAETFQDNADVDLKQAMNLDSNNTTKFDLARFPYAPIGSGFGLVADFIPSVGWKNLFPINKKVI